MGFNNPTPKTEDLYIKSINTTVDDYRAQLEAEGADKLVLPDFDLDSGVATRPGEYTLTDETYASLLAKLAAGDFNQTTPQLRANILAFYADPNAPIETRKDEARWQTVQAELSRLKSASPAKPAASSPAH